MVQILGGKLLREDITSSARGGTELMAERMVKDLDRSLLEKFQIVHSRVRDLDRSKKRIFVAHDLPGDPESAFLANGGYNQFDLLVFVSNWQMQKYIEYYGIPWYKCRVILNAIDPISSSCDHRTYTDFDDEPVKLVYHTTPHRGLDILAQTFYDFKVEKKLNITLDVFSSFEIYGWKQRDEQYQQLFEFLKNTPGVTYHGSVEHEKLNELLPHYDIFAYPSIWPETSCLSLMEAMAAGLICVHPNFAALPETAAGLTAMYQWRENKRDHAKAFSEALEKSIKTVRDFDWHGSEAQRIQMTYAEYAYGWSNRIDTWNETLRSLL